MTDGIARFWCMIRENRDKSIKNLCFHLFHTGWQALCSRWGDGGRDAIFAGVHWAVFPASHAWSCMSNNPGARQVKSGREVIDLPHQTHHHWCCLSANTCLADFRALLTLLDTVLTPSILTLDRALLNHPINQIRLRHQAWNLPPHCTSSWQVLIIFSHTVITQSTLLLGILSSADLMHACARLSKPDLLSEHTDEEHERVRFMLTPHSCCLFREFSDLSFQH